MDSSSLRSAFADESVGEFIGFANGGVAFLLLHIFKSLYLLIHPTMLVSLILDWERKDLRNCSFEHACLC